MALPSFTYSVSRKYPQEWFTWFVIIGGICATVLFSSLNLAADGYVLDVDYTSEYNETLNTKRWTQYFPFTLVDKTVATCQSQVIPVNMQFLTNNSALTYTLTAVGQGNGTLPVLEYTNNFLEDCSLAFIQIDLLSTQRTASQQGWSQWGPKALAQLSCSIYRDAIPTSVNITVDYEFLTPTIETGTPYTFVQPPSNQTDASLWWGQSLLSWNWLNLAAAMATVADNISQGSIIFRTSQEDDMTNLGFFSAIDYHFTLLDNGTTLCCANQAQVDFTPTIANLSAAETAPNIWLETDSLAKTFYATIMADLGQMSSFNMLANSTALEYFSTNLTQPLEQALNAPRRVWRATDPATQPYSVIKNVTGPLNINPSIISQQYLCQVPKLKPGGALFFSILLADLVFLQALWKIVTLIAGWRVGVSDPRSNYCEGCAASAEIELLERPTTTTQNGSGLGSIGKLRPHLSSRLRSDSSGSMKDQLLAPRQPGFI